MSLDKLMPDRPDNEIIKAIYAAWGHYGPANEKRFLGTPEAERIYREIRKVLAAREEAV